MRTLSARQLVIFRAVAATIVAEPGAPVPPDRLDFTVSELRLYAASMGRQTRLAFGLALLVVQLAPLFLIGRLSRFTNLADAGRLRCLERLETSPLGLLLVLLKTMVCFVYYEHPDALASTGYDGVGLLGPAHVEGASPLAPLVADENPPRARLRAAPGAVS